MMRKDNLIYLLSILMGILFTISGIQKIYVDQRYNIGFICFGVFVVILNVYFLLKTNK